ncbi:glycosyltransferase family 2 protein [Acidovorax sp. Leaf160]|uniref:glycosyltransferase n=1 Tax=Acidovorax sp. Leaf160 TaxID=1736280 RepID=UPI000700CCA1|nr:glycosyltransferase [Acidovorax sp. Leaf160]KQR55080.1 glycosyl transferase [Acidovorax sp. Leaf160]
MIGVVVPAHDEEAVLNECLQSLQVAARHPGLRGEPVQIVVALDACSDRSEDIALQRGVQTVRVNRRNVGAARSAGVDRALHAGARWLCFTDADSAVAPDWLVQHLRLADDAQCDAVCGTVEVRHWGIYGRAVQQLYHAGYSDEPGHRHIHGANLGVSAHAYRQVGGFAELRTGEDVALVGALEAAGLHIAWTNAPRVVTSARCHFRAPSGFGAHLAGLVVPAMRVAGAAA